MNTNKSFKHSMFQIAKGTEKMAEKFVPEKFYLDVTKHKAKWQLLK